VAEQHDVAEILEGDDAEDVLDMRIEIDRGTRQMRALAEPGVRRRDQAVARLRHQRMHLLPGPSAGPCTMTKQKSLRSRGHRRFHRSCLYDGV
jgi:hypothetical protein